MSEHGTIGRYRWDACRCEACTAAIRESQRRYRERKRLGLPAQGRPERRTIDGDGNIRCRKCGNFKPADAMAHRRGRATTICRPCEQQRKKSAPSYRIRRELYKMSPEYLEYQRRCSYARHRAYVALAADHPAEYERHRLRILAEVGDVEVVAIKQVRSHERAVFDWPDESVVENEAAS